VPSACAYVVGTTGQRAVVSRGDIEVPVGGGTVEIEGMNPADDPLPADSERRAFALGRARGSGERTNHRVGPRRCRGRGCTNSGRVGVRPRCAQDRGDGSQRRRSPTMTSPQRWSSPTRFASSWRSRERAGISCPLRALCGGPEACDVAGHSGHRRSSGLELARPHVSRDRHLMRMARLLPPSSQCA
jgi:hypothetical protein